jgi:hypothetical protein
MTTVSFKNERLGIESSIHEHAKGFSVSLKDLDSGNYLPSIKIFRDIEAASKYAYDLVWTA